MFVLDRFTEQYSRLGESKSSIDGGAAVRFQTVYRLRRYSPSPVSCLYPRRSPYRLVSSHTPSGMYGRTLGPPSFSASRPDTNNAWSRRASPVSRSRGARASRRLSGSRSTASGVAVFDCL